MAMDLERQKEVGARIKELRGPKPQPVVAEEVGVTLRAYQAWEAGDSGIAWENLQKLATTFNVTENYLLYGMTKPDEQEDKLDRIESELRDLRGLLTTVLDRLDQPADGNSLTEMYEAARREARDDVPAEPQIHSAPPVDQTA